MLRRRSNREYTNYAVESNDSCLILDPGAGSDPFPPVPRALCCPFFAISESGQIRRAVAWRQQRGGNGRSGIALVEAVRIAGYTKVMSRRFQFSLSAIFVVTALAAFACWMVTRIPAEAIVYGVILAVTAFGVLFAISVAHRG